ncbi:NAD-dependent epimerase/dehydratase family protein [Allokutzneria sp. A3M-2-11 16]|uniref:NAD-dependent epimerase/dehydratase family protein n=1 Tax=Allokutzneria sp. A3M-2-11 16 TaxID=2962043 RepID=UPI0020B87D03|nr:NAD-dependent epimerase/dehydratase family protein [Allokutzneria sp. A3M-2-11 16]MCP3804719.1 NAD-dependent epimerase/dehydratase family protein [Allokutzneria sp. A3M-2-11 16]
MRIAVTGASGNVGTALLRALPQEWSVAAVARRRPDQVEPYARADWTERDIGTGDLSGVFAGADAVVHLAWAIHPRTDDPEMRRTNIVGTENVLAAARRAKVPHVVFGSSVAAYKPADRWAMVDEDWPLGGVKGSAYSRHKAEAEALFAGSGLRFACVRPASVVQRAAGTELRRWLLSSLFPLSLLKKRWLPLPLWPGLRLQLVHADDVASALVRILERGATGAFNLAADPVLTANDIGRVLGGIRVPVPFLPLAGLTWPAWRLGLQPLHPGWLALADKACLVLSSRARAELDWHPEHDSADALAEVISGMAHGAGAQSPPLKPDQGPTGRLRDLRWGRPTHQSQGEP